MTFGALEFWSSECLGLLASKSNQGVGTMY